MKKIVAFILSISLFASGMAIIPVKAEEKLSADEWKSTAIVNPANGSLIGAGHIDLKWNNNLGNVSKYSAYVDNKLVKTLVESSLLMNLSNP